MVLPGTAHASPSDPSQWPAFTGADPELTATPNTIRFAGPDRYQTNLALGLGLRGNGDFPFDTSDRTSGGASGLAQANDWWGAASCPRSIIVVAGDIVADSLAAASLSDPTDQSSQPRLERVAAADPLFDPIGGIDRPDTAYAPIVVTTSGRSGATALSPTARMTASDLVTGGCTTAKEAIIVGGTSAVPKGVESDLIGIGFREVFRVGGHDRYETAANVAAAMGSSAPTSDTCIDPTANDGATHLGWYGNAAFEYRSDARTCRVLPRAVVLADGGTGADALAAGWWTSYWQVPVLLTAPDGSLPTATRIALQTLEVDTIIVLGGTDRIPETTVDRARFLAGAVAGRIAGVDRTETSIAMAQAFGGWIATGDGSDFAGDVACFAASSGSGPAAVGWPDALAAGPLCARIGASGKGSPQRAVPPLDGPAAASASTGGTRPSHDAVPIILLQASDPVPESVSAFLGHAFDASASWCSGTSADPAGCVQPGFGVMIGGVGVISEEQTRTVGSLLGGGGGDASDASPTMNGAFPTFLDLTNLYQSVGSASGPRLCIPGGGLAGVRWVSLTRDTDRRQFVGEADVLRAGVYPTSAAPSHAVCVNELPATQDVAVSGVSLSGRVSEPVQFRLDPNRYLSLSAAIDQRGTSTTGPGALASWSVSGAPSAAVTIMRGGSSASVTDAQLHLDVTEAPDGLHATVRGDYVVTTPFGSTEGAIDGIAVRSGTTWELAGRATAGPFAEGDSVGGFRATVVDPRDGSIAANWRFDGF